MRQVSYTLLDGDAGTMQTLGAMWAIIDDAANAPRVKQLASNLYVTHSGKHHIGYSVCNLFDWMKAIRFKADPWQVEHLQHPDVLFDQLRDKGRIDADCDCASMLAASVLRNFGLEPVLMVMGRDPTGNYQHVCAGFRDPDGGPDIAFDPQETDRPGALPTGIQRLFISRHPLKNATVDTR